MFGKLLEKLRKMPDTWEKRLFFMGILTKALEDEGTRPIVVGGHAVEFYTLGGYATADIDIAMADSKALSSILTGWEFEREGRHWYSEELGIAIESPTSTLAGDVNRVTEVEVDGLLIYIIGIEDIIIDRLNAYVYWNSAGDGEWAEEMLALHHERIDRPYLEKRAKEEGVEQALKELSEGLRG